MHLKLIVASAVTAVGLLVTSSAAAMAADPITLSIDASNVATQNVLFAHEHLPVSPGKLTLYYPKWIPGEHMVAGPIANFAGLVIKANGQTMPWRREPKDLFAFDVDVPQGVSALDINMAYLGSTFGSYSTNRLGSANMAAILWDQTLLYPSTGTIQNTFFDPSITVPAGWHVATALPGAKTSGNTTSFSTVSLEHLVDSPMDIGLNYKRWELWQGGDGAAYLNVVADTPEELDAKPQVIADYSKLVREMLAMYGARHWRNYNFLLTVSDVIPGEGIEHHESSDDGTAGDLFSNPKTLDKEAGLLSHEFNHSWDGKYRMPDGLYQPNLQMAYDDSLLWVYEGMTQYYGNVMSWRDGLRESKTWPDHVAATYAYYDYEPGRMWRPLLDTAVAGPVLYTYPRGYSAERRSVDFYSEGELMWLKVDSIIREKTNNKKSLDTFARAFFGQENTGPIVKTYTRSDVIVGLNEMVPYDWAGFFKTWVDDIAIHPPDGFTAEGWKLVYNDKPQHFVEKSNFWYSIGVNVNNGEVSDVRYGSPAWKAGLGINTKIVAVDGRSYSDDALYNAIEESKGNNKPVTMIVTHTDDYRTVSIDYHDGPRYPHLERVPNIPDRLSDVVKPYTK